MTERAGDAVTAYAWTPTTDDDLTDPESWALDALFKQMTEIGGGTATMCAYDTADRVLGSVTVAKVNEMVLGIVVRSRDDYSVIPCVMGTPPSCFAVRPGDDDGPILCHKPEGHDGMHGNSMGGWL